MRDKELSFWTCRGEKTAGFFVAEINEQVVGTVSYLKIENENAIEIFRLSVDPKERGKGVANELLWKVESTALVFGIDKIIAETSEPQTGAMKYYEKNGWEETKRSYWSYLQLFLTVVIVTFVKKVKK